MDTNSEFFKDYDFQLSDISERIKKDNIKRIGLQFPEGLKRFAVEIASEIEKMAGVEDIEIVIFANHCYGACDLREIDAEKLGLDLIIHFGHERL